MDQPEIYFIEHTKGYVDYATLTQSEPSDYLDQICFGIIPCTKRINQEYLENVEKTIGYGSLFDIVRTISISRREWNGHFAIGMGIVVGDQEILYGLYENSDASDTFDTISRIVGKRNDNVSAVINPSNGALLLLKENVIKSDPNFQNRLGVYLSDKALCSQYQTFNIAKDNIGINNSHISKAPYVDVPLDTDVVKLFDQIRTGEDTRVLMDKLMYRSAIYLESTVPVEVEPYPQSKIHGPAVDTAKMGLLRRNIFGYGDQTKFEILDNGKRIHTEVYDPYLFDIVGLRFIKFSDTENMICIIQSDGTLISFAGTKRNLLPYLENGDWSCFYWPAIKFFITADGNESFNSFDGLYLFAN